MNWQSILVYAIIIVVFAILVRNAWRMFTRDKDVTSCPGCDACNIPQERRQMMKQERLEKSKREAHKQLSDKKGV